MYEQKAQQRYNKPSTGDYMSEPEEDEAMYITRSPSSAVRLNTPIPTTGSGVQQTPAVQRRSLAPRQGQGYIQPGAYTQGDTRLNVIYGAPPTTTKKGRTIQRDTEEPQTVRPKRRLRLFQGWRL